MAGSSFGAGWGREAFAVSERLADTLDVLQVGFKGVCLPSCRAAVWFLPFIPDG